MSGFSQALLEVLAESRLDGEAKIPSLTRSSLPAAMSELSMVC